MNIETIIAQKQRDVDSAHTRYDRARQDIEDILSSAQAAGRSHLTATEDGQCDILFETVDKAKADLKSAESSLERASAIKGEDDEYLRQSRISVPTNAGMRNRGTATISAAGLAGAGGSYERDESPQWTYRDDGRNAVVGRDQRFSDHEMVREYADRTAERDKHIIGGYGSFGAQLRALSTTSASAIVPTQWSFPIIDKARNNAVAFKAGATLVPMPSKVVQVGRLTVDPVGSFRNEGSTVTATDPTLDFIQLTATTLSALTVVSMEFIQDAPDADTVVSNAIAASMALALDQVIFYGQLAAGSEPQATTLAAPNPRGILQNLVTNAAGQILGAGTNGTAQTAATPWNEVVATYYAVKAKNETPSALVSNDKLVQQYNSMYTSFNNVIDKPPVIRDLPWLTTNMIGSFTQGTMTSRATDLFCGDFSQVLVGQRLDFTVRVLQERYAELGQVGILSHWRGDVQVARPLALACYRYLQGA
jgi:HK97 family phage major capsid protein